MIERHPLPSILALASIAAIALVAACASEDGATSTPSPGVHSPPHLRPPTGSTPGTPSPSPSGSGSGSGASGGSGSGDGDAGGTSPDAGADPTPDIPGLGDYLQQQMTAIHTPGLAAALVKDDQLVWSRGYGYANVAKKVPVTTATLFHLASVSKTVTATAVMQLVEGGLSLDDDVSTAVGFSVRNPSFASTAITLRMLLSH